MKSKPTRKRLDLLLVERGLAASQKAAQAMVLAGEVTLDGGAAMKAGAEVSTTAKIEISDRRQKYASRGGLKLEGALEDFSIAATGKVCLDIGSSTGGFTDCLLQRGAARVFAVDVNIAQLDWKLRKDPRVTQIKRNARDLTANDIGELADLVIVDVSFISVTKVLPPAAACAQPSADFLILIKPQFEVSREDVPAGGVVEDERLHKEAVALVQKAAEKLGLECLRPRPARLRGTEGNQEFFLHARKVR